MLKDISVEQKSEENTYKDDKSVESEQKTNTSLLPTLDASFYSGICCVFL